MHFFVFLTVTALAVSLDSMLTGFAVGLKTKFTFWFSSMVAVVTFCLCSLAVCLGVLLGQYLGTFVTIFGALCLVTIGVINFVKKGEMTSSKLNLKEGFLLSMAVGLDASVANLSISLMGYTSLWIPMFFAVMHFVMVTIGFALAKSPLAKRMKDTNKIAGVLLIGLGIIKLF